LKAAVSWSSSVPLSFAHERRGVPRGSGAVWAGWEGGPPGGGAFQGCMRAWADQNCCRCQWKSCHSRGEHLKREIRSGGLVARSSTGMWGRKRRSPFRPLMGMKSECPCPWFSWREMPCCKSPTSPAHSASAIVSGRSGLTGTRMMAVAATRYFPSSMSDSHSVGGRCCFLWCGG
jgi:hypothetical protein